MVDGAGVVVGCDGVVVDTADAVETAGVVVDTAGVVVDTADAVDTAGAAVDAIGVVVESAGVVVDPTGVSVWSQPTQTISIALIRMMDLSRCM